MGRRASESMKKTRRGRGRPKSIRSASRQGQAVFSLARIVVGVQSRRARRARHGRPCEGARLSQWFFTSDLHGQGALYEQLVAHVAARQPEAVLIGGDLCPHAAGPEGVSHQRLFLQGTFVEFARRLKECSAGTALLVLMGNDDWSANMTSLEVHDGQLWHLLHERIVRVDGFAVAGLSWVPITPFVIKDWERWDDGADETPLRLEGWSSRSGR